MFNIKENTFQVILMDAKKDYNKPEIKIHGDIKEITMGVPPTGFDDAKGDVS